MTMTALVLLLMTTVIAAPRPGLTEVKLDCPVCKQVFNALFCPEGDTRGGIDRDLFAHALGPEPVYYRIATCPKCGYSGYSTDFDPKTAIPPDVRDKILKKPRLTLPKGFGPESEPRDLDAADRYALAITCYQYRRQSKEALAWLNLRAAWVARDEGSLLPPEDRLVRVMKFIERWRPPLPAGGNQVDVEMRTATRVAEAIASGRFNRFQKPYVELALALILRRHGEHTQAVPMLDALVTYQAFPESLRTAIKRMRDSIDLERRYQTAALECFEAAVTSKQISPANHAPACYLLGELNRRLGHEEAAISWYDRATQDNTLPGNLKTWAQEQRAWCASGR
ncbi:MAG: DUF2225 domain-containing protein [Phycisphaerae bacterium]|nr:DUF2225 domain-containing protein [Phycisphaerae bacterium]